MARKTTKPSRAYSEKNPLPLVGVFFLRASASGGARRLALLGDSPPPSAAALSRFPPTPLLSAATAADKREKEAGAAAGGRSAAGRPFAADIPATATGRERASSGGGGRSSSGGGGSFRADRRGSGEFPKMFGSGEAEGGRSTIRVVVGDDDDADASATHFPGDVSATARRRGVGRLRRHGAAGASVGRLYGLRVSFPDYTARGVGAVGRGREGRLSAAVGQKREGGDDGLRPSGEDASRPKNAGREGKEKGTAGALPPTPP